MIESDQLLSERACGGDPMAATELLKRHYQAIFAYLRRLCGGDEDAADLTQRAFAKAWSSLATFRGQAAFSSWLHGIARHVYLDWLRQRDGSVPRSDEWWEARASAEPDPASTAEDRDLQVQLYRWVDQLDDQKKQTVHLHYYQGLSLEDTAGALGIATSTVKYRLREALEFLRSKTSEPKIAPTRKAI
jgi:RNA polymerase sigma-70 factor (ECF subfamily)